MKAIYLLWPIRLPFWMLGFALLGSAAAIGAEVDWEQYKQDYRRALFGKEA